MWKKKNMVVSRMEIVVVTIVRVFKAILAETQRNVSVAQET